MNTPPPDHLPDDVAASAVRLLETALGGSVRLGPAHVLATRRSLVLRLELDGGPDGAPASAILKRVRRDERLSDGPRSEQAAMALLFNEWAGYQFLRSIPRLAGVSPALLGGDRELGFILLEDLGDGECLADVLLGSDPARAEAALLAYAGTIGRINGQTIGRDAEYRAIRAGMGPGNGAALPLAGSLQDAFATVVGLAEGVGTEAPLGAKDECQAVMATLEQPGPFLAFSPSDICPDNNRWYSDGRLRLFDFEGGGFRHALLDGAYCRLALPTCWCVNRVPDPVRASMEARYRVELAAGCPAARDDAVFAAAMLDACAAWLLWSTSWLLPRALDEDRPFGPATARQCILLRLDLFATMAEEAGRLEALGGLSRRLGMQLRSRWPPEVGQMSLYPAFQAGDVMRDT